MFTLEISPNEERIHEDKIYDAQQVVRAMFRNKQYVSVNGACFYDVSNIAISDDQEEHGICQLWINLKTGSHATIGFNPQKERFTAKTIYYEVPMLIIRIEDREDVKP